MTTNTEMITDGTPDIVSHQDPVTMIELGEDVTNLSIGERTNALLGEDSESLEALATFRIENSEMGNKVALLLPGIVPSSAITYSKQKQALIGDGYEVVSVDYSTHSFRQDVLRAQFGDFINSKSMQGKNISFVALSFGTTCVIDFLTEFPEDDTKPVDNVVFIGTLNSFDAINDPFLKQAMRVSHKLAPALLKKSVMPFVKRVFRLDPSYADEFGEAVVRQDLAQMSSRALAERIQAIADIQPTSLLRRIKGVDALFIGWERDYSTLDSLREGMALFDNSSFVTIPGRHGQTASSAPELNAQMMRFLNSDSVVLEAV